MRAISWLLVLAALAVVVALAARHSDGYVLVVMAPWRIELSLNFALVLLAACVLGGHLFLRLVRHAAGLPAAVADYRRRRGLEQAERAFRDALRLFAEGRYGHALRSAERAYGGHPAPGLVALAGWQAAHALHDAERSAEWEAKALAHDSNIATARLMVEAEFALDERRFDDAREALRRLAARDGRHIAALRLALRAEQGVGNWQEVVRLARQLEKHKALSTEQAASLRRRALREAMRALADDPAALRRYWQQLDEGERSEPGLALIAANALAAAGDCREAQRIVEDALEDEWDADLVLAYADCRGGDVLGRIARAEKWLQLRPRDATLLLTLGRLCIEQQLWGKARSFLEASIGISPGCAAHVELARLLERLDESALAARHYREAALL